MIKFKHKESYKFFIICIIVGIIFSLFIFCSSSKASNYYDQYDKITIDKMNPTLINVDPVFDPTHNYTFYCINNVVVVFPKTNKFGSPIQLFDTQGFPMRCKHVRSAN